jgi:NAD(P)-dependent dehydrogenase (short-subunit alcohol dehydrogenase family)
MDKSSAFPREWTFADIPDQSGRIAVVTGASSGLGLVVAEQLCAHGADVVMAVRDLAKGERVRAEILGRHPTAALQLRRLDLADLDSVNRFADELGSQFQSLDLLVNNAGIGGGPRRLSPQGYELTWATDFLGPFAMTGRLLPTLEGAREPRVVTVSSNLYKRMKVTLPLDDPSAEKSYSGAKAYVAAKTADLVFAVELDRRLRAHGSSVRSLAAHPGVANTPMQKSASSTPERVVAKLLSVALGRSPEAGALPLLYAAVAPDAPAGRFLGPALSKRDERVYADEVVAPANDHALARRLWSTGEQLTGVSYLNQTEPIPTD